MGFRWSWAILSFILLLSACKKEPVTAPAVKDSTAAKHIKVQHILIGFEGTMPGKEIKRTEAEAQKLAAEIMTKATQSTDFDALVKEYSDDRAPGIYALSDKGEPPQGEEFAREDMSPGFGDLSFSLKVNEIGLVPFDKTKSALGFHIIKRLE